MSVAAILDNDRKLLLQLSGSNPAINFKEYRAKGVLTHHHDLPALLFRLLDGEQFQFRPTQEEDVVPDDLGVHEILFHGEEETLIKRLQKSQEESKLFLEEQGLNILYLSLGYLGWKEDDRATKVWRSPLVLVPVRIQKGDQQKGKDANTYYIQFAEEEIEPNLSLYEALQQFYKLQLPEMPNWEEYETAEELKAGWDQWLQDIQQTIRLKEDWEVNEDCVLLSFFSFAKFQMYKDLEADNWCTPQHPQGPQLIKDLLREGFGDQKHIYPENTVLDRVLQADQPLTVLDMDSSQAMVLLEAKDARCMVVQGPPGTGKSQTITNIIADAVNDGKKVLFVAEKMAALEVVKNNLTKVGLGPACLELHGARSSKTHFIEELRKVIESRQSASLPMPFDQQSLTNLRDELRNWSDLICNPSPVNGYAPYELFGLLLWSKELLQNVTIPSAQAMGYSHLEFQAYASATDRQQIGDRRLQGPEAREVALLQEYLQEVGSPTLHPFFGTELTEIPLDSARLEITEAANLAEQHLLQLMQTAALLKPSFPWMTDDSLQTVAKMIQALSIALSVPDVALLQSVRQPWQQHEHLLREGIEAGIEAKQIQDKYAELLISAAWDADLLNARTQLATTSDNFWNRSFNGDFKAAKKQIVGLFVNASEAKNHDPIVIADAVLAYRDQVKKIESNTTCQSIYGPLWQGLHSDWELLTQSLEWMLDLQAKLRSGQLPDAFLQFLSGITNLHYLQSQYDQLSSQNSLFTQHFSNLRSLLQLNVQITDEWRGQEMMMLQKRIAVLSQKLHLLPGWIKFFTQCKKLRETNKAWLVQIAYNWPQAHEQLANLFRFKVWEQMLQKIMAAQPALQEMTRNKLNYLRQMFNAKDEMLKEHNKVNLINRHSISVSSFGNVGQSAFIRKNLHRKRNIPPVRKFLRDSFDAIASIKPVFMMSPLSVAGYLEAKPELFDLVIFDEASQIEPVDAFGAILRGKQVIVVGDTKQMPPTSFFKKMFGSEDNEDFDDDRNLAADVQSIMELMLARNAKSRSLLWHYRSRHDSLIAVSNKYFYDNKLLVYPSAANDDPFLGLKLHCIDFQSCPYQGQGVNYGEAKEVAQEVLRYANEHPDKTLGVVAFNIKQKEAIEKEVQLLAREHASLSSFVNRSDREPFFIKNLENVQGDERDTIFISIGYGKTQAGVLGMNFGPLNREGGERRLNVLITRARLQNKVFTNFTADDLDLSKTNANGLRILKAFLYYAEHGRELYQEPTGMNADSVFEEQVLAAIQQMGYDATSQVGSQGYRIDIAVKHPQKPGRYVLAVECDGAAYHSAQSARDRDRLRQSVLEGLGWKFYRIWSANWFYDLEQEKEKLRHAIEDAIRIADNRMKPAATPVPVAAKPEPVIIINETKVEPKGISFADYKLTETNHWRKTGTIYELKGAILERYMLDVIHAESPVHTDHIFNRIVDFQETRLGARIRRHLADHLDIIIDTGKAEQKGDFIWKLDMDAKTLIPRDYSELPDKHIGKIAPEEIDQAFLTILRGSFSAEREELITETLRKLGFIRAATSARTTLAHHLDEMIKLEMIVEDEENSVILKMPLAR